MTRRSQRELERAAQRLDEEDGDGQGISLPYRLTDTDKLVDENGDPVDTAGDLTIVLGRVTILEREAAEADDRHIIGHVDEDQVLARAEPSPGVDA